MRRKDREVIQVSEIEKILDKCKVFRIAMFDEDGIYIVPLNFGYLLLEGKLELYFHGAKTGKKIDLLDIDSKVGFEMDCEHELVEADNPCDYSYKYASITGQGKASVISSELEKIEALNSLMKHQMGSTFEFNSQMIANISVYKIIVDKFSAKRHL